MKTILVVALLAVVATSAIAQLDMSTYGGQGYYQPWQMQMSPCREFLTQQCSPLAAAMPFLRSRMWQASSCQVMRQQCCRQLAQIPEQSRCQAIYGMAHAITQQQCQLGLCGPQQQQAQLEMTASMALQTMPAMCSVYVSPYCSAATAAAAATSCAGGACY